MKHIILTRYNLPISFANSDTSAVRQQETWLTERKVLFDKYCLPAMKAQTNKNFSWFIGFDPQTPPEYWDYLEGVGTPVFANSRTDFRNKVIEEMETGEADTIISRVDNDDALSVNFVETVQAMAAGIFSTRTTMGLPHVLHFRHGWEIDHKTNQVYTRQFPNSSFFSLLLDKCKSTEIFDIDAGHHAHVSKHFPVTNISLKDPMWMISVHGDNIGNEISGKKIDAGQSELLRNFGVDE